MMNFAIINEHKTYGGAEVYVKNLRSLLEKNGHKIICLYLCTNEDVEENEYDLKFSNSKSAKYKYSFRKSQLIRSILKKEKIDVVIINNVFSEPLTLYASLYGCNVIQVLHDYAVVCPKSTCITDSGEVCKGYKKEFCIKKCSYHNSKLQLIMKLLLMAGIDVIRKNVVNLFISPSKRLAEYSRDNQYKAVNITNPLLTNTIVNRKLKKEKRKYVYIGNLNRNKGLYDMLPAFEEFASHYDVYLNIYGKPSSIDDQLFLKKYCSNKITYNGFINHNEIMNVLRDAYALLTPSFWMENYPTTVLEGFMSQTLVIGSDRGGIPELLKNNRGICFAYGRNNFLCALKKSIELSEDEYNNIIENAIEYVNENNIDDIYYKRLMELIKTSGMIKSGVNCM